MVIQAVSLDVVRFWGEKLITTLVFCLDWKEILEIFLCISGMVVRSKSVLLWSIVFDSNFEGCANRTACVRMGLRGLHNKICGWCLGRVDSGKIPGAFIV